MKMWILAAGLVALSTAANAQNYGQNSGYSSNKGYGFGTGSNSSSHSVSGYTNSHGTYVQPHQATNPNSIQSDNYGSRGNYNPYTGSTGTRSPRY